MVALHALSRNHSKDMARVVLYKRNHTLFSKTRTRKWQQSDLFQKAFYEIVKQCIDSGLIDEEAMAADGSYIPANVSRESWINVEIEVEQSMQSYLDSEDGKCHLSLSPNLLFCWNLCGFQQFFCFCQQVQFLTGPYLDYNNRRIKAKLKGLPPAIHRQQALSAA